MSERQPWQIKLTDDDFKPIWPTLLLDWVEWQGPVQESWPPPAHQRIFFAGEGATKDLAYAREILGRFATRAYRRPVRAGRSRSAGEAGRKGPISWATTSSRRSRPG